LSEPLTDKPRDAASVVLVRSHPSSLKLETLLLCRGNSKTVSKNLWVFPGGKVETGDAQLFNLTHSVDPALSVNEPELNTQDACALYNAACRETEEECGVVLSPDELHPWARWETPTNPAEMYKRFDARFFLAEIPTGQTARHDGVEAVDSLWIEPEQALEQYCQGKFKFAPPQIIILLTLAHLGDVAACVAHAAANLPTHNMPHVMGTPDARIFTFPGDRDHPQPAPPNVWGPTRLIWQGTYFEPPGGFDQYLK